MRGVAIQLATSVDCAQLIRNTCKLNGFTNTGTTAAGAAAVNCQTLNTCSLDNTDQASYGYLSQMK